MTKDKSSWHVLDTLTRRVLKTTKNELIVPCVLPSAILKVVDLLTWSPSSRESLHVLPRVTDRACVLYGVWKEQTDFDRPWIEPQCSRASRPGVSESSQVLSPFCGVRYESASIRPLSFTMRVLGNMIGYWCIINADGQLTCCRLACDSPERWCGSAQVDWGWVRSLLMVPATSQLLVLAGTAHLQAFPAYFM